MSDVLEQSREILNLSRSMLNAAEATEWNIVEAKEKQRQSILSVLNIREGMANELSGEAALNLQEAGELNQRIINLGLNQKAELAKMIGIVHRGRKATQAYES